MIPKKLNISDNFIIFLFATLPIAAIIGNFFINFYLFCILLLFIYNIFKTKNFTWLKDKNFRILSFFYLYICINSLINFFIYPQFGNDGLIRSLSFLKFLILFPAIPLLIDKTEKWEKIFKFWLILILIVIIDVFFEKFNGSNLIGFRSLDGTRITSFFYDENVVGTFLLCFGFITTAFFLENILTTKNKIMLNLLIILILFSILITGERSPFLKSAILFLFIIYFIPQEKLVLKKFNLLLLTIFLTIFLFSVFPSVFLKQTEFFKRVLKVENPDSFSQRFENIKYFQHYNTAIKIFENHKLNGVGNKNFRFECHDKKYFKKNSLLTSQRCSTHPHQIHFELMSEQGLIGYLIFIYFLFSFFKEKFFNNLKEKNIFKITLNFYLLIFLIPVLPSGSLFATFNGLLFWIVLGFANSKK